MPDLLTLNERVWPLPFARRVRMAACIAVFAFLAAACSSTTTETATPSSTTTETATPSSTTTETAAPTSTDTAPQDSTEDAPATGDEDGLAILFAEELTIISDITAVSPAELDLLRPEGQTCANGSAARTPYSIPQPSETAMTTLADVDVVYSRISFDSADDAVAVLESLGPGGCEAVIQDSGSEDEWCCEIIEDQPLDLSTPTRFSSETTLLQDPDVISSVIGLLYMQNGTDGLFIATIADTAEEATAALEVAAGPYR